MRYALRPVILWAQYWPQLAACYLLGLLGRTAAIEWAGWAGYDNNLWASLIMPLAGMARLGSYVAMFLLLRPAFPILADLSRRPARRIDLFTSVVVPFFAIYLAWQMFREDWLAFEQRALVYRVGVSMASNATTELHPDTLPGGVTTWALIGAALVLRLVLSTLKDRLPAWMVAVRVYVDALWVFLAVSSSVNQGIILLTNPTRWVGQRRTVVWFNETRAELFSHFKPLEVAWDAVAWSLRTVFGGAGVPLIWLAVAGIVYGVTLSTDWRNLARRVAGERAVAVIDRSASAQKRLQGSWYRAPKAIREKTREHGWSKVSKFRPIADSARIILHAGFFALALYVLGYLGLAWLDMSGSFYRMQTGDGYLFRGMAWLIGPHPASFWAGNTQLLSLISHLIIEPLRICLVASTFVFCVEKAQQAMLTEETVTVPVVR